MIVEALDELEKVSAKLQTKLAPGHLPDRWQVLQFDPLNILAVKQGLNNTVLGNANHLIAYLKHAATRIGVNDAFVREEYNKGGGCSKHGTLYTNTDVKYMSNKLGDTIKKNAAC